MKIFPKYRNLRSAVMMAAAVGIGAFTTSCDMVYDDLDPCDNGIRVQFVYTYHIQMSGNAFPTNADCVTLYVFNDEDYLVATKTETSDVLRDENYRMTLDLEPGDYKLMAYAGLDCDKASHYSLTDTRATVKYEDMGVALFPRCLGDNADDRNLHDLFVGVGEVTVNDGSGYDDVQVKMMRNTNQIRINLQQLNYQPVDGNDFEFKIVDDNTRYDYLNNCPKMGDVEYHPWKKGSASAGWVAGSNFEPAEVKVGFANIATGRLLLENNPRLVVYDKKEENNKIIDIPLIPYLMLSLPEIKESHKMYKNLQPQEYLDRENQWNLYFFLDENRAWVEARIVINNWEVRIDNVDLGIN